VPTVVATPAGLRLIVRTTGRLQVFGHDVGNPLSTWWTGASGLTAATASAPSAVALESGEVLAAVETDTPNHVVGVERFSSDGSTATPDLPTITGYVQPSLATDGLTVWMVMIRKSDGFIVSRSRSLGVWDGVDQLEVGSEGGGGYAWPNLLRQTDGRLRFVFDGPGGSPNQNSVLAFQRLLSAP
jgi:hypothetical protein